MTSALAPGQASDFLIVATNASAFDTNGGLSISGEGNNQSVSGQINNLFEPTFLPEPSTALLFSIGLIGMAALRKRIS
jgi:PEP-CTERM motif